MKGFGALFYKNKKVFVGDIDSKDKQTNFKLNTVKNKYFGKLVNGQKQGFGILEEGNFKYVGEFQNNERQNYFDIYRDQELFIQGFYLNNNLQRGFLYCKAHPDINFIEVNYFDENYNPNGICNIILHDKSMILCEISQILKNNNFDFEKTIFGYISYSDSFYSHYSGEIRNLKSNGIGVLRRQGLVRYQGQFKEGKITGFGKMIMGEKTIIGNFINGISDGFGIVIFLSKVLQGQFVNGRIKNEEYIDITEIDLKQYINK